MGEKLGFCARCLSVRHSVSLQMSFQSGVQEQHWLVDAAQIMSFRPGLRLLNPEQRLGVNHDVLACLFSYLLQKQQRDEEAKRL